MIAQRYSSPAIALHWLIALLIVGTFCGGLIMTELKPSPEKLMLYSYHKWAGVTVFGLAWLRLFWRVTHTPPAPPLMPLWQAWVAKFVHLALYLAIFAIPLTGWLQSSAAGYPTVYLGLVQLPDVVPKNAELKEILEEAHELLAFTTAALVALHVAGAVKHHFINRDGLLRRMWWST